MKFERCNDELTKECDYFVNGKFIAKATHTNHGWAGIDLAEQMFGAIAKACGQEVVEIDVVDTGEEE